VSDAPVQIIVGAFKDPQRAGEILKDLKGGDKERWGAIHDAAVVTKDAESKLHITDTKDMSGTKGMVVGAVVGGAIGLFTGGIGLLALGGGGLGGLAAKLRDGGLPDKRLRDLGAVMPPNSSALVVVIDRGAGSDVERSFRDAGGDVVVEDLTAELAAQLKSGEASIPIASEGDKVAAGAPSGGTAPAASSGAASSAPQTPPPPAPAAPPAAGAPGKSPGQP